MVEGQSLEAIKGGGGSIKVGTTGTINALMTRELQLGKVGSSSAVPLPNEASTSSSGDSNGNMMNGKHTGVDQKAKSHHARRDSRNPFLRSDSVPVDENGTSNRRKNAKKGSCLVEIVDVKRGVPNRLKKLTFSKLSEANGVK
ncbi:uncharacterized protein LOC143536256 [Bidens hawaiensis]|uniref:uncharacterized protein LOC143536256 n=1 Tax=Bidens hawaiensis TaxID=980011 RepID=UPI00404A7D7A